MNEKTPGQIAFEAWVQWYGHATHVTKRSKASPREQAQWGFIGQAVAQAVAPVPEP